MAPLHPDRVPSVRVLVVGDAGAGKTSLAALLSQGEPPAEPPDPTQGADVFVRLLHVPEPGGGAPRPCFVELWDVGAEVAHAALRPLFYTQVAGVILVHDLTRRRGAAGLVTWASELASASFAAPASPAATPTAAPAGALAARLRELGVPVPALVVGTKADVVDARRRGAVGAWLGAIAAAAAAPALRCAAGARAALARHGIGRARRAAPGLLPEYATRAERDAHLFGSCTLRSAAPQGRVDAQAVDAFFRAVLASARPVAGGAHSRSSSFGEPLPPPPSRWDGRAFAGGGEALGGSRYELDASAVSLGLGRDEGADGGRLAWADEEGGGGERALWEP